MAPLALAFGDPAGIGAEIILAAWAQAKAAGDAPAALVVGGPTLLAEAAAALGLECPLALIEDPREAAAAAASGRLPVLTGIDARWTPGAPSAQGARAALASLEAATRLARAGQAAALVTAPVAKSELAQIGWAYPGQTEYLAEACGIAPDDAVMMLAGPSLRAVPLTVHVPLAAVASLLSADLIIRKARIVARALQRDFGLPAPRLAIAALNPHAGEGGLIGEEEERLIAPAIAALRAEGIDAFGPVPGDALFTPRARARYDAALAMYHDQALIPLKALEVDEGVNITLGLPIIRTSPDHGTAFDIAGTGRADPGAMLAAIRMAAQMAAARAGS